MGDWKIILQGITIILTLVGFGVLGGKHVQSIKFQATQRDEDVRNQGKINTAIKAKQEKQDTKISKTVREIYNRLRDDDIRREDRETSSRKERTIREDEFRKNLDKSMAKITDRIDKNNELFGKILLKLGES